MKKLFIILFCFFYCYINAKVTDNCEGTKLINDSKSYLGDKHISKKDKRTKLSRLR